MKNNITYWKKTWKDQTCGINNTRLRPGKNNHGLSYSIFLKCRHGFYRKVLIEWVRNCPKEQPTCPLCRQPFNILDYL